MLPAPAKRVPRRSQEKGGAGFLGTDWSLVATTVVIIGAVRVVDDSSITLGGSTCIFVPAGVPLPEGLKVGMSLTVTAVKRDGVLYAEKIQLSPQN